jgi:cellulose synthase/poly-beta-1,6-N-acetylglucosamine synthase-like glycosyltransferase
VNLPEFIYWTPLFLILIVFMNRYFLGPMLSKCTQQANPSEEFSSRSRPTVCVVIPLYNEGESIYRTLQSIVAQTYPRDLLSVTVVDDNSKDDSAWWAKKAAAEDERIHVHCNSVNIGKRLGIARAVRESRAEIIVSVDSDVILERKAIEKLISRFTSPKIAAVGGKVMVVNCHENWLTQMQTIKYFFGYEFLKSLERSFDTVMCLSGCLTAYRRKVLLELEEILQNRNLFGIPIKYGEDRFLTRQVVKAGYKTRLELEALCYTKVPTTLAHYFSQQLRWRRSNLVDLIGALSHVTNIHPLVAIHYLGVQCLVLIYPLVLWQELLGGRFEEAYVVHFGVLSLFSVVYFVNTRTYEPRYRVHPVHFLWMGFIMPVSYLALSVAAVFTLDSGNWETRKTGVS